MVAAGIIILVIGFKKAKGGVNTEKYQPVFENVENDSAESEEK